ncbi:alpha-ketoglutarate-dependent dioxygenase AlkB family protein [Flavobacterium tegetincola]|uniref:alpha-ketoglutarate-dependent dioxygenase AlkB family protein n=1 Tax=Flavobacterium tegetincola TaxID=150172 RepID=UPI00041A022D|nr:alpha-ketoglutarate-dependent dioxygenase AlkB [Flavobacterium tegetincola]
MTPLFSEEKIEFNLPDAEVIYYPAFLESNNATLLYKQLLSETPWQSDSITLFGKTHPQPRLTAFYGADDLSYSYSNIKMLANAWSNALLQLKIEIEQRASTTFNSVLLNLYRDGKDSNGWHADNEKELGINPIIASVTLGSERFFHLKHIKNPESKCKIKLEHGSLLLMKGSTQHFYKHQIPKTLQPVAPRINLTFRSIKKS